MTRYEYKGLYTQNVDINKMKLEDLNKDLDYNKRNVKEANNDYKILRCYTDIPSIIIECGFITNPEEENKLKSEEYQVKIADTIVKSIKEYFAI